MSSLLRNIERGRERVEAATETCVHCGRKRRPHQVWQAIQLGVGDYICIDEASCIKAKRAALAAAPQGGSTK